MPRGRANTQIPRKPASLSRACSEKGATWHVLVRDGAERECRPGPDTWLLLGPAAPPEGPVRRGAPASAAPSHPEDCLLGASPTLPSPHPWAGPWGVGRGSGQRCMRRGHRLRGHLCALTGRPAQGLHLAAQCPGAQHCRHGGEPREEREHRGPGTQLHREQQVRPRPPGLCGRLRLVHGQTKVLWCWRASEWLALSARGPREEAARWCLA